MFTWNETVAISLISILRDPELVIYFMSILKPIRRKFVEEEAREWHLSLRITQEERWKRVAELSMKRKFSQMNASVPITCTLPFDGGMWRNSKDMLKMIRYFRPGFIRETPVTMYGNISNDETIKRKTQAVNLLIGESLESNIFRSQYSRCDADEALGDLIHLEDDPEMEYDELPYIVLDSQIPLRRCMIMIIMN